jgi:uncharacterized delta-60 repeat protein
MKPASQCLGILRSAILATIIALPAMATAASGDLDKSFGRKGVVSIGPPVIGANHNAVATTGNAIISAVVSGASGAKSVAVYKSLEDGSSDASFGSGGSFALPPSAPGVPVSWLAGANEASIATDRRDRILVLGATAGTPGPVQRYIRAFRLLANGALDASFSGDGVATIPVFTSPDRRITRIHAQADRKILISTVESDPAAGGQGIWITRLNEDGTTDMSFAVNGIFRYSPPPPYPSSGWRFVNDLATQSDGRIVVALRLYPGTPGNVGAVMRLTTSGALDTSFGSGGMTTFQWVAGEANSPRSLTILGDDSIVVGGGAYSLANSSLGRPAVARFTRDGALDSTFGIGGLVSLAQPPFGGVWLGPIVDSAGSVSLGGIKYDSADYGGGPGVGEILRLQSNGAVDTRFAHRGTFEYAPPANARINSGWLSLDRADRVIGSYSYESDPDAGHFQPVLIRLEANRAICK